MDKNTMKQKLATMGVAIPKLYLPKSGVEYSAFAVIACDQHTANLNYWDKIKMQVGNKPSALHLIFPEVYLEQVKNLQEKIAEINDTMSTYIKEEILKPIGECFVFLERQTTTGTRCGLMLALDLEQYDYTGTVDALICATEKTVAERLPSRIEIRKNAPLEIPHVMVLIDDKKNRLMSLLKEMPEKELLYDFDLMAEGGHLTGWKIGSDEQMGAVVEQFSILQSESETDMLFAVGDGNHSLAAAKECWEAVKNSIPYGTLSEQEKKTHPARFVLVELVNLHDPALMMEPVHRVLFGVDKKRFTEEMGLDLANLPSLQELQPKLDTWLTANPTVKLDYIHGAEEARALGEEENNVALTWAHFDKNTLFETVREKGALVRKSFSMGEAKDKRYYLECRKIK